ncbi:amidase [Pseudooceanicola sp.]|uniref:amidase n=1 Tax=Pseudooceanicola sp. TaxID=1914328 RepID=UPI00262A78A8|nr:amidase [Pseudooceanicola sp.]MDF1856070.1 amidase [Pseudooceanicola sp.]
MTANQLTVSQALERMRRGLLSPQELLTDCLDRIRQKEDSTQAWLHLDAEAAQRSLAAPDKAAGQRLLPGIPVGIKDIIDVRGMPTSCNSPASSHDAATRDAAFVGLLRAQDAVILGKTDTVEFASGGRRARTRNPHDPLRTPGASSSGSAAAVADFMVPLAFGTQTAGSVIRPAVFCGIYGFKPSHGAISLEGVKPVAPSVDTLGWFTRSAADLALVAGGLGLALPAATAPSVGLKGLRLGLCRTPYWHRAELAGRAVLDRVADRLSAAGAELVEITLPAPFDGLAEALDIISQAEGGRALQTEYVTQGTRLAPDFRQRVEQASALSANELLPALDLVAACRPAFDALFRDGPDALITLAAPGVAPLLAKGTGDPIFCGMWTALHAPTLAIPAGRDPTSGMPIGIQIVGARQSDGALLALGEWIAKVIDPAASPAREEN